MTGFDSLFLKYNSLLFRFTLKFIDDENEARDLVQDLFIEIWERGQYNDPEVKVRAYLFAGVKNRCLNYIKHQKVVRNFECHAALQLKELEASYYLSGEQSYLEKEAVQNIENAIDSLADIYKEVVVLSRFEGLKNKEIAERLNIPVRTVETRIFRALTILRESVQVKSVLLLFINRIFPKFG